MNWSNFQAYALHTILDYVQHLQMKYSDLKRKVFGHVEIRFRGTRTKKGKNCNTTASSSEKTYKGESFYRSLESNSYSFDVISQSIKRFTLAWVGRSSPFWDFSTKMKGNCKISAAANHFTLSSSFPNAMCINVNELLFLHEEEEGLG